MCFCLCSLFHNTNPQNGMSHHQNNNYAVGHMSWEMYWSKVKSKNGGMPENEEE